MAKDRPQPPDYHGIYTGHQLTIEEARPKVVEALTDTLGLSGKEDLELLKQGLRYHGNERYDEASKVYVDILERLRKRLPHTRYAGRDTRLEALVRVYRALDRDQD